MSGTSTLDLFELAEPDLFLLSSLDLFYLGTDLAAGFLASFLLAFGSIFLTFGAAALASSLDDVTFEWLRLFWFFIPKLGEG
jgi:hypothetical protein